MGVVLNKERERNLSLSLSLSLSRFLFKDLMFQKTEYFSSLPPTLSGRDSEFKLRFFFYVSVTYNISLLSN